MIEELDQFVGTQRCGFYTDSRKSLLYYGNTLLKLDFVLLETGLGGRLDATNILPPEAVAVSLISRIAVTAPFVADWISPIWPEISSVAFAVWLASDFTSDATTANPRPASHPVLLPSARCPC